MNIQPWKSKNKLVDPFESFDDIQKEMNRLFNYITPKTDFYNQVEGAWAPAVDIYDEKEQIKVVADLPGLEKDQIDITAEDGILTIKGEKQNEKEIKERNSVRTERTYGSFYRSFTLPNGVDTSKINASFKNGVLEITIPKSEEAKSKQVKIDVK